MKKVKGVRKNKNGLATAGLLLCAVGGLLCLVSPKDFTVSRPKTILANIEESDILKYRSGIIKNGDEFIPYYVDSYNNYYNLETGEYIGKHKTIYYNTVFDAIVDGDDVVYFYDQVIPFSSSTLDSNYDKNEVLSDEDAIKDYSSLYLGSIDFWTEGTLNKYELKNNDTNETITLYGFLLSDTQFFSYETMEIIDCKGYDIRKIWDSKILEDKYYDYTHILGIIETDRANGVYIPRL